HAFIKEYLPLTLLPQRLNTIRNIRFRLNFNGPLPTNLGFWRSFCDKENLRILTKRYEKWQNIWHIISSITGLRQLHVTLCVGRGWAAINQEGAAELLRPIKQVTRPDVFVLTIP
ncbi:hypothetical protein BKA64DRAFT_777224, partial [Cadophora sp. MPI-SDFR-AT-0126]